MFGKRANNYLLYCCRRLNAISHGQPRRTMAFANNTGSKRTYNPHFHFIVSDSTTAEILVSEWLSLWTKKFTLRVSQNIKPVNNNERALIEL